MSQERSRGIVGLFILITVLFFIFLVFAFLTISSLKGTSELSKKLMEGDENGAIGVISIEGAIMESRKIVQLLHTAEEEKSIKAIILRIDSPGGAVAPTQEIYEEIRRIDQKKPVYASFGSLAASGGYYIGAATRKIFSSPGTLTGSIGVIMQFADLSELFQLAKVKPEIIKAGKFKDVGSPHRSITEEEKKILNDSIQITHQQFINHILEVRQDRITLPPAEFAQGQIFSGEEALKMGLVDELCGLWEAGRRIEKELKLENKGLRFLKPKKKPLDLSAFLEQSEDVLTNIKQFMTKRTAPAYLMPY